jgi:hypothetical protein
MLVAESQALCHLRRSAVRSKVSKLHAFQLSIDCCAEVLEIPINDVFRDISEHGFLCEL